MTEIKSEELKIAIVGAGIAGLALAIGLHKQNIPFTLFEEAAQYSTVGAGIGFGPNGLLAMDMIEEGFRSKYEAICVGNKSTKDQQVFFEGLLGKEGLGLDQSWYGSSSWGSPNPLYKRKSAHRRELLDILTSFIPSSNVQFSKKLTNVEQEPDKVILHFADGEFIEASALIGADGIDSIVRKNVLGSRFPDEVNAKYANSYTYRAVIPMSEAKEVLGDLTDTAKMYLGHSRTVVSYRVSGGEEFNFLHGVYDASQPWHSPNSMIQEVSHEQMMADFEDGKMDHRLLALLEKARPIRWGLFHHIKTSTYVNDRIVLIGDSAHASLPYQAAGAGQGAEDAAILSDLLGYIASMPDSLAGMRAAFEAYDAVRRPRAQRQAEQSLEAGLLINFQDSDAGDDMQKVLDRMQGGRFDWLWFHDLKDDVKVARDRTDAILKAQV